MNGASQGNDTRFHDCSAINTTPVCRIDSGNEATCSLNGGILHNVLRRAASTI
ncbi:MAG: hypothetical protein OXU19_03140 [bacterium]|nr:hypothetical protein [bacterium]